MYLLVKNENSYKWSSSNIKTILILILIFTLSFIILSFTRHWVGSVIVCAIALGVFYFTLKKIMNIMEFNNFRDLYNFLRKKKSGK